MGYASIKQLVKASTRIIHNDPKAEYGVLAMALAAQMAGKHKTISGNDFVNQLKNCLGTDGNELIVLIGLLKVLRK